MNKSDAIFIAGHTGLIGSAFVRRLTALGFSNLLTQSHESLDLENGQITEEFFQKNQPKYVILAAGKVGGIVENQRFPASFMNANLSIQLNVLKAAHRHGVNKLILFASSCMYPRECPQPMPESALLSHYPEPTSLAYAVSKLAGMQMCLAYNQEYGEQRFIPVIPNSVYGPNDNFDPNAGHVLSSLIRRFYEAKQINAPSVNLWGTGTPRREFIHADDIANACLILLNYQREDLVLPINLGVGADLSISELAKSVAGVVGYTGQIEWDTSKPDGAPRKLLDSARMNNLGWKPMVQFEDGLKATYDWYLHTYLSNSKV
jgi:GDP-L-fucose synthase